MGITGLRYGDLMDRSKIVNVFDSFLQLFLSFSYLLKNFNLKLGIAFRSFNLSRHYLQVFVSKRIHHFTKCLQCKKSAMTIKKFH